MKTLNNLKDSMLGLDGEPIVYQVGNAVKPETLGRMMANVLARAQSNDPVKAMMVAMQIHGAKSVTLEDADFTLVKEAADKDTQLTNLGKAALLTALNGAKEKAAK